MSDQRAFNPALVFALIAAGIVSFALFLGLLAWGGNDAGARRAGRGTALSVSAIGFKGLYDLTARFIDTELVRDSSELRNYELLVVTLEPTNTAEEVSALLERRRELPTLLILPKWMVARDPANGRWVRSIGPAAGASGQQLLAPGTRIRAAPRGRGQALGESVLTGIRLPVPASPQVIEGERFTPLVTAPGGGALVARVGDQPHYVVADPDLMNNQGLRDPARAQAAVQILLALAPEGSEEIRFDLTTNGVGAGRSLVRSMLEPPFLAMTLALVAAAILAGLHGAIRFGPPRRQDRAIPFGKAALVENSAALIRLAKREVRLGGAYADVMRDEAGRASAAPAQLRGAELEAYLDRFGRRDQPPFSALASATRSARDRADLTAATRALFRWKKDLIR